MLLLAVNEGMPSEGLVLIGTQGQVPVELVPNGSGGGTVNAVHAGPGITVTGTATDPIVNNAGVLSVAAGPGIALSGTAQNPIVNNAGVLSVGAGTNVTLTGTAQNPVVNVPNANSPIVVTAADFVQPGIGATVLVQLNTSADFVAGQFVPVAGGGAYELVSAPDATHVVLRNLGGPTNAAELATIATGAVVSRGAMPEQLVYGLPGAPALSAQWNADALMFSVDAASPALEQEVTGFGVGQAMSLQGQSSLAVDFTPAPVYVVVPAAQGAGDSRNAAWVCGYGDQGIVMGQLGPNFGFGAGWSQFHLLAPDSGTVPDANNWFVLTDLSENRFFNAGSTFFGPGSYTFSYGENVGGGNAVILSDQGVRFFAGSSLAGGNGVIGLGDAPTPASQIAAPGTGGIVEAVTGALTWLASAATGGLGQRGVLTTLAWKSSDAPSTQQMAAPKYFKAGTTVSAASVVLTVTPRVDASFGVSGQTSIRVVGRTSIAGAAGAIGDTAWGVFEGGYSNVGGAVTIIGALATVASASSASLAGFTVTLTASGATYLVTVTAPANAGANVDWEIFVDEKTC